MNDCINLKAIERMRFIIRPTQQGPRESTRALLDSLPRCSRWPARRSSSEVGGVVEIVAAVFNRQAFLF